MLKIDNLLRFLEVEVEKGTRWGDIPLSVQLEAVNILYADNKKFYDGITSGQSVKGKCDVLIEDCYCQYEFLQARINPFYDKKEAP